jgi:hypothetical protein
MLSGVVPMERGTQMSLMVVERWYQNLPAIERSQPLILLGDTAYSPDQVLAQVRAGTALGQQLQSVIERRAFTPVMDKYGLALARIKQRLSTASPQTRIIVGNRILSPQEFIYEAEQGTPLGRQILEAEIQRMETVLQ